MIKTIRKRPIVDRLTSTAMRIAADPEDSDELRLQKTLMVSGSTMIVIAGFLWSLIYFSFEEYVAGLIPFTYCVISSLSIIFYSLTRRYQLFRFSQLLLILLLPFLLMIALGGFVNSSAVILWALLCPLGALLFSEPRRGPWWFLAYAFLVVLSGFLQPYVRASNNLSPTLITLFFVMNIVAISAIAFILLYYFVFQKNTFIRLLAIEQDKSERLLLNILPKEVAEILKVENRVVADHYENASILFADLVGFTPLTAEMEPEKMVELLNEIYSCFDDLVEKYDLEKIRTIGDNYMVVSGVPRPRQDHAEAISGMALDMRAFLREFTFGEGERIHFRIGINSGSLVAGVVGRRKFQYDVWGDAVNVASRMESQGVSDQVQITAATRELIKDKFRLERRGTVEIKGKGEMETWFLVGNELARE
ncbi:MAG: adenylate/guanylate cyclase domain-containing protein [Candidatus Promineifilaceae bacterium]